MRCEVRWRARTYTWKICKTVAGSVGYNTMLHVKNRSQYFAAYFAACNFHTWVRIWSIIYDNYSSHLSCDLCKMKPAICMMLIIRMPKGGGQNVMSWLRSSFSGNGATTEQYRLRIQDFCLTTCLISLRFKPRSLLASYVDIRFLVSGAAKSFVWEFCFRNVFVSVESNIPFPSTSY